MSTTLVWLLITVSAGHYNFGTVYVVERFPTAAQCEHVRKEMPAQGNFDARCIQAHVVDRATGGTR